MTKNIIISITKPQGFLLREQEEALRRADESNEPYETSFYHGVVDELHRILNLAASNGYLRELFLGEAKFSLVRAARRRETYTGKRGADNATKWAESYHAVRYCEGRIYAYVIAGSQVGVLKCGTPKGGESDSYPIVYNFDDKSIYSGTLLSAEWREIYE